MSAFSTAPLVVTPARYQSQDIALSEWVTLLTLCLAPLIAHVVVGTPSPSYLCTSRPKWHEWICHYNPTSVLWRYTAITDRRIRARFWNRADLAATNALFWTPRGWDGSEAMVQHSLTAPISRSTRGFPSSRGKQSRLLLSLSKESRLWFSCRASSSLDLMSTLPSRARSISSSSRWLSSAC